jgi:hypothetical protein
MRIANAITDLRQPPSIEYSEHQLLPTQLHHSNSLTRSYSRTQGQSLSLPGTTPATSVGHVHFSSMQSQQSGHLQDSLVNINDDMKAAGPGGMESGTAGMSAAAGVGVGLGIALPPMNAPSEVSSFMNMCP